MHCLNMRSAGISLSAAAYCRQIDQLQRRDRNRRWDRFAPGRPCLRQGISTPPRRWRTKRNSPPRNARGRGPACATGPGKSKRSALAGQFQPLKPFLIEVNRHSRESGNPGQGTRRLSWASAYAGGDDRDAGRSESAPIYAKIGPQDFRGQPCAFAGMTKPAVIA